MESSETFKLFRIRKRDWTLESSVCLVEAVKLDSLERHS